MKNNSSKPVLIIIFCIALALRLMGITHGFPFIFHPDEPTIVRSALGIRFNPNPGHFDWPHLYIYANYVVYMMFAQFRNIFAMVGLKPYISSVFPLVWDDNLIFYLITRIFTALLGALTIIPVYKTGKRLFGAPAGILGALTFAILPFHVQHSHYSLPDVPMVFFLAWSMYFASGILTRNEAMDYAGAGTYTGFAATTKYNGGLSAIGVPLAHIMRVLKTKEDTFTVQAITNIISSGILAFMAFVFGTPYFVADFKTFKRTDWSMGALWQFKNVGKIPWSEMGSKIPLEISRISDDLGYTVLLGLTLMFLIIIIRKLLRIAREADYYLLFLYIMAGSLFLYVAHFSKSRSHYYLIMYPYIAVIFGYFLWEVFEFIDKRIKFLSILVFFAFLGVPFYLSSKVAVSFMRGDTRILAYNWVSTHSKGVPVFYDGDNIKSVFGGMARAYKGIPSSAPNGNYIIVVSYKDVLDKSLKFRLLRLNSYIRPVVVLRNDWYRGPNITIYAKR